MITELPPVVPAPSELPEADGAAHPMRAVTAEAAFQEASWTAQRARDVAEFFGELAPVWNQRIPPEESDGILDALERGEVPKGGRCLEIGAGTGHATRHLRSWCESVIAIDISEEMLHRLDSALAPRVLADGSRLPFPDGTADVIALANMFLFPAEVTRLLAPDGRIVWYNGIGEHTPIHLSAEELIQALSKYPAPSNPEAIWQATASRWANATWCVLHMVQ